MKNLFITVTILLALTAVFLSCEKKQLPAIVIEAGINIIPVDPNGNNLLMDAAGPYSSFDSMWLYYVVNGTPRKVFNRNLDASKGMRLLDDDLGRRLNVFPYLPDSAFGEEGEHFTTSYLQWNSHDMDTIYARFVYKDSDRGSSMVLTDVWYNGVKKYPDAVNAQNQSFTVVK